MAKTVMKLVTTIGSLCLLTACTTTWYKPGATQQDFAVNKQECLAESYREAPPSAVAIQTGVGYNTPTITNCGVNGNNVNCISTGGEYVPPPHINVDQNATARAEIFKDCMYKHGWSTEKPSDESYDQNITQQSTENYPLDWKGNVYLGSLGSLGPSFQLRIDSGHIAGSIPRCKEPIILDTSKQGNIYAGHLSFTPSCLAEITNSPNIKNCSLQLQVKFDYVTSNKINGDILLPIDDKGALIRNFINMDNCQTVGVGSQGVKWTWIVFDLKQ